MSQYHNNGNRNATGNNMKDEVQHYDWGDKTEGSSASLITVVYYSL